ncbi:hypothetical protein BCD49_13710 [Pseudofrankia sp. EUN1h]|nr:hypothetical protein BCD49_13710 [Pseudofrankia sp. EUN1h]
MLVAQLLHSALDGVFEIRVDAWLREVESYWSLLISGHMLSSFLVFIEFLVDMFVDPVCRFVFAGSTVNPAGGGLLFPKSSILDTVDIRYRPPGDWICYLILYSPFQRPGLGSTGFVRIFPVVGARLLGRRAGCGVRLVISIAGANVAATIIAAATVRAVIVARVAPTVVTTSTIWGVVIVMGRSTAGRRSVAGRWTTA